MAFITEDTIAAIATPPGRGGIGIVRVSGPAAGAIATGLTGRLPPARQATLATFADSEGRQFDHGLVLFFPAPASFTGDDVLELQGHGGPVLMDLLLARVLELGARQAGPGEFSARAFLNDKLDLTQAEAIADLIDAETVAAVRLASRSLQGVFSRRVDSLVERLTRLRCQIEAGLDFPEEDIELDPEGKVSTDLRLLNQEVVDLHGSAHQGRLLRDGMTLVIAGRANAGKSSLLNALAGYESAIVTPIAGTTRDLLRERIQIDGMPLHVIDTAGLRDAEDVVEAEGIRRARAALDDADLVLWVYDATTFSDADTPKAHDLPDGVPVLRVRNKIDLSDESPAELGDDAIALSAKTGAGLDLLHAKIKTHVGLGAAGEGEFSARRRHLEALNRASDHLETGQQLLQAAAGAELLAEELRLAQNELASITGAFSADDLLGEIFSSFCIGK